MLSEIEALRFQNSVMKEKLWAKNRKTHRSEWFFLVNTKYKPTDEYDKTRCEGYLDEIMSDFTNEVREGNIINVNRKRHEWSTDFVEDVRVRYVVETGHGIMKKDGTRGKVGGEIHLHVLLTVIHHSNISLTQEALKEFFAPKILFYFATKAFVGRPRLTTENRTEEYMQKGFEKAVWKQIEF